MADISLSVTPTDAASRISEASWGIDSDLTGFIIQSEDYTEDRVTDQTQDQKGRVIYDLDYDRHFTCTLQVIGNGALTGTLSVGSTSFNWRQSPSLSAPVNWKVQSVTYNGSYNDKKKYTINLERWAHYPSNS